jgi:hypothetical protein
MHLSEPDDFSSYDPFSRLKPPLETFTAADLQGMDFPPINYVVPGYLVEGLTILAGKPKLGKSWLALDWALATAYGGTACGSIQCEWGDVLYCALEDNKRRLQRRLKQLLPSSDWPGRLELITSLKRLDDGGLDAIRKWAEQAERPRLIVLDTLACVRPTRSCKDNSYDTDYAAISPLQGLAGELNLAVLVIHHVRKMESDDPLDMVSGTTGLTGAADTVLVLRRDSQGTTLYGRGRDVDEIETAMSFDITTGRWKLLGAADEVRRSDERSRIVSAMLAADEPMGPSDIAAATGMKAENVRFLLHKMVGNGEIRKVGRASYAAP